MGYHPWVTKSQTQLCDGAWPHFKGKRQRWTWLLLSIHWIAADYTSISLQRISLLSSNWVYLNLKYECQSNLEKKEQSWKYHTPWLETILQSYNWNSINSMVLTQKQTHRSTKQNREPRKKPVHLQSIGLQHRRQEYITEKTVSSTSSAGKTGQLHVKEHKNKFKSIKDLNVRLENIKLLKENLGRTLFDMNHSNIFLILSPKA